MLQRWLYDVSHVTARLIFTTLSSMHTAGQDNIPKKGRVLIIGPHRSDIDPFVIGCAIQRRIRFLGKKQISDHRLTRPFFDAIGMVPVDRENPAEAAKALHVVRKLLEEEEAVLLFPEGERTHNEDGSMQPFKDGASLLAKCTHAPVVPVGLAGTFEALSRFRKFPRFSPLFGPPNDAAIGVSIGEVIQPEKFISLKRGEITQRLFEAVACENEKARKLHRRR